MSGNITVSARLDTLKQGRRWTWVPSNLNIITFMHFPSSPPLPSHHLGMHVWVHALTCGNGWCGTEWQDGMRCNDRQMSEWLASPSTVIGKLTSGVGTHEEAGYITVHERDSRKIPRHRSLPTSGQGGNEAPPSVIFFSPPFCCGPIRNAH